MRTNEDQLRAWMIGGLDGNAADHTALLSALVPILRAFYRRRSNDGDIEDLIQETLIVVHTRRTSYDRSRTFAPWLFAIARHKMIDHFRRNRRTAQVDGFEDMLVADDLIEPNDARQDVEALLDTLPAKQAQMIRATRIEGMTTAEVSAATGFSESDVKISVHRGLKRLISRVGGGEQ